MIGVQTEACPRNCFFINIVLCMECGFLVLEQSLRRKSEKLSVEFPFDVIIENILNALGLLQALLSSLFFA